MYRDFSIQNWDNISLHQLENNLKNLHFNQLNFLIKSIEYQNPLVTEEKITLQYKIHWNPIFWYIFGVLSILELIFLMRVIPIRWSYLFIILNLILSRIIISISHSKVINELYKACKN